MGIVIGAGTTVSFRGVGPTDNECTGATQVQWQHNPGVTRLYQLGKWAPCDTISLATQTLNLTFYVGSSASYSVLPDEACNNTTVAASVNLAGCNLSEAASSISGDWFVTGYNYSKSAANQPATEAWSLMRYTAGDDNPNYNIRGMAEGTVTTSYDLAHSETLTGVDFAGTEGTTVSKGYEGSVSAGQVGRENIQYSDTVQTISNGLSPAGKEGSASVTVPYTPIWDS